MRILTDQVFTLLKRNIWDYRTPHFPLTTHEMPFITSSMSDRSLCSICAWRADCNKKFKPGAGIHCPDFSRDMAIKNSDLDEEAAKQSGSKDTVKKPKKGLWPM